MSRWVLVRSLAFLAMVLMLGCPKAFGQVATGEILGTVTDASGASVPGADVTVTDTDTGISHAVKTDEQGRYDAPDLQIGTYRVEVQMQGFSAQAQQGLVLAVGQRLVSDFKLQVGAVTQEVTVTSTVATAQVNTTTSEVGGLVNETQLQELPLNGRDYEQLFALVPGVQQLQAPQTGANFGSAPRFSVAGARTTAGSVLLDGVEIRSFWGAGGGLQIIGSSLGVEGIAEFQTLTSSFNAQYSGISVVNQVTRSGTNNFHGSAYGFFRNSAMDARGFFDPLSGPPAFHRNQFGGAIGGPIKKNKTFFFVNYEGLRAQLALQNNEYVPDANTAAGMLPCYETTTGCSATPTNPGALINEGISPNIAGVLALYPAQAAVHAVEVTTSVTLNGVKYTGVPTGSALFTNFGAQPQTENYLSAKLDHQLTAANKLSFRYVIDHGLETNPWQNGGNPAAPGDNPILGSFEQDPEQNQYMTAQETHVFSANVINVASVSFVRTNQQSSDNLKNAPASMIFLPNGIMGTVAVTGALSSIGTSSYLPLQWLQNTFTEQDEVDWVKGAHTFKFGGEVRRIQCNCNQITGPGGTYTFAAWTSGGPVSSLESFLEAEPNTLQGPLPGNQDSQRYGRQLGISGYVQDDWKATRKITFNLGLRYDFITNPTEATGVLWRILSLDPSKCSNNPACDGGTPEAGISGSPASAPGCATVPVATSCGWTHENHYFASNPSTKNIDPRIGLAWDVFGDHKTSFRAGFGIFHSLLYPREYVPGGSFGYPQVQGFAQHPTFPHPTNFAATAPLGRNQAPWNYSSTPYTEEYNATIERQLPLGLNLSVGYVGSTSIHMVENVEENATIPLPGSHSTYRPLPADTVNYGVGGAGYIPNSAFSYVQFIIPNGNANYNSGVISVKRSLGNGIQLQSGYTYSRCLDYASGTPSSIDAPNDSQVWLSPQLPKSYNYGPCAYNTTSNWTSNALIPLPFHGNQLKEGWQVSLISSLHTGQVVTPTISFDRSNLVNYFYAVERPNLANNGSSLYTKTVTYGATPSATVVQWFNPAYFSLQGAGYIGNAGRGSIVGPGLVNFDMSLMKSTKIRKFGEASALEIRADAFNIANHPNFALPAGAGTQVFTGAGTGTGTFGGGAGKITSIVGTARQLQFSARFVF